MMTSARIPDCHPDQEHMAHGECRVCYAARYYRENRERYRALNRAWEQRNRGRSRLRRYGMTPEQYARLLAAQNGVCAICATPPGVRHGLSVDHDHNTGRVRALLCAACNAGIGQFRERPDVMYRAIRYLYDQQVAAE